MVKPENVVPKAHVHKKLRPGCSEEHDSHIANILSVEQTLKDIVTAGDMGVSCDTFDECSLTAISVLVRQGKVRQVGFDSPRYIATQFNDSWKIEVRGQSRNEQISSSSILIEPKLWNTLDGSVLVPVKRACVEAVLSLIVDRPGIYENSICSLVSEAMTRMDVHEICNFLVERNAVSRILYRQRANHHLLYETNDSCLQEVQTSSNLPTKSLISSYLPCAGWFKLTA